MFNHESGQFITLTFTLTLTQKMTWINICHETKKTNKQKSLVKTFKKMLFPEQTQADRHPDDQKTLPTTHAEIVLMCIRRFYASFLQSESDRDSDIAPMGTIVFPIVFLCVSLGLFPPSESDSNSDVAKNGCRTHFLAASLWLT